MAKFTVKIQRAIPLPMANQLFSALFAKYPAFEDVRIVLSALFAPCFPFLPDRLLSFPQRGNFIKQFPADNRRMVVRHHPPAFPWIFSDFSIRFIVGDAVIPIFLPVNSLPESSSFVQCFIALKCEIFLRVSSAACRKFLCLFS